MVSTPSPFQSPTTGRWLAVPYVKSRSAEPAELELRNSHLPARYTPMVSLPSPSQSPTTGRSPAWPKLTVIVAVLELGRMVQVPSENTAGVSEPLPSQSPISLRSPDAPNVNVLVAGPADRLDRSFQTLPATTPGRARCGWTTRIGKNSSPCTTWSTTTRPCVSRWMNPVGVSFSTDTVAFTELFGAVSFSCASNSPKLVGSDPPSPSPKKKPSKKPPLPPTTSTEPKPPAVSGGMTTDKSALTLLLLRNGVSTARRFSWLPASTRSARSFGGDTNVPLGRRISTLSIEYRANALEIDPVKCTPVIFASSNDWFWIANNWSAGWKIDSKDASNSLANLLVTSTVNGAPEARVPSLTQ